MNKNAKGAAAELIACAWLIGLGYQVFRNVCPSGPADIMIWDPETDEKHVIDVKSFTKIYRRADGAPSMPMDRNMDISVHMLVVEEGAVVGFWRKRPEGGAETYYPLWRGRASL